MRGDVVHPGSRRTLLLATVAALLACAAPHPPVQAIPNRGDPERAAFERDAEKCTIQAGQDVVRWDCGVTPCGITSLHIADYQNCMALRGWAVPSVYDTSPDEG